MKNIEPHYLYIMKNNKLYFVFLFLSILFASCNGEEVIEKWPEIGNYYDSSKPIELKSMSPDWEESTILLLSKETFRLTRPEKSKFSLPTRKLLS